MGMDSFCRKNKVPESVKNALKARYGGSYIYILGDKFHISNNVKKELAKYGHVERILVERIYIIKQSLLQLIRM